MNLPDGLLGSAWIGAGWGLFALILAGALRWAPWRRLTDGGLSNVWLGSIVALTLLWSLKAGVLPGLSLHLLGAMVFTLEVGPNLAFLGLTAVLAAVTLNGSAGWEAFGLNALLMVALPVGLSWGLFRLGDRYLPKNVFVFIFANGFFGSALVVFLTGLTVLLALGSAGLYPFGTLFEDYLPYFLLLGFSEGWLAGMVVTLMVIYRPEWVSLFDDAQYLAKK
ncbi:energy-coupling factor ABC transporter permease [Oryzomicrobium sp.]|uniref:energy-coupling factor ABC transporter permease n=1 Tax=Oryzomicrobium sp. TaxID=1911578 RepID=UPI0025D2FC6E|nr:energy-coupling factor ABC transporter permease [Oryzomicrobium sp.]MCE1242456.1 energy-coupling factor ABC transporter permease [Oryzomicrobium sp.]